MLAGVEGDGRSLFGWNWLKHICLNWSNIATIRTVRLKHLHTLMHQHQSLFAAGLGTLQLPADARPRFFKPHPVPFAIKDAVGHELDKLEQQGIIQNVTHSDRAAPIVAIPRSMGICVEYKVTINQVLSVDQYPLPKPEDLFTTLAGRKVFTKLNLSQACIQCQLDENST